MKELLIESYTALPIELAEKIAEFALSFGIEEIKLHAHKLLGTTVIIFHN